MKYLPLYYNWMETGKLPGEGLCGSLPMGSDLKIFRPYQAALGDDVNSFYWGYDGSSIYNYRKTSPDLIIRRVYAFTPLRQNIVLFLAAMNGEL